MKSFLLSFFVAMIYLAGATVWADDDDGLFSGKLAVEAGAYQPPGQGFSAYQYSHLDMESHPDLTPGLSFGLEAQATAQDAGVPMVPSEPDFTLVKNYLDLEWETPDEDDSAAVYSLELEQAYLHWASGSLDMTAGLFKPSWGTATFYRPTDYFFPLEPLQWLTDEPLASEGLDARCFLFDDLSVEGAVRFLNGGISEEILKLVNKGIGITLTPSFAWMSGRKGLGLEAAGTFPDFKAWVEGVDWFPDNGGGAQLEWTAGVSTIKEGIQLEAEAFQDATGEALGTFSNGSPDALYLSGSAETKFQKVWKTQLELVKSTDGGPLLLWPHLGWKFSPDWEAGFQAQWPLAGGAGPLGLTPGRTGISGAFSF